MSKYTPLQQIKILQEVNRRRARREANKKDFTLLELATKTHENYQPGWVHKKICDELEDFIQKVERQESPRLIINMPPQHGKSTLVSEKFPVRILSSHPNWNVIVVSYSSSLAEKFSRKSRDCLYHPFVINNAPQLSLSRDKRGVEEWETTKRGGYKAVGIQGSITGSPARIIIIDDPLKDHEEAYSKLIRNKIYENYRSVLETRLSPGGGILLTQTRWHEDDLTGRLLKEESDKWRVLKFPAIAEEDEEHRKKGEALHPERYTEEMLRRIEKTGGWTWNALYRQSPVAESGNVLKRQWWKFHDGTIENADRYITSWDMSFKDTDGSDYVVGQVWAQKGANAYLVDQVRGQLSFAETEKAVVSLHKRYPQSQAIYIEDKANGPAIISSLKNKVPGLIPVNPEGSKEARVAAVSPYVESGNVYLPQFASFTEPFIEECASFPRGTNDDQVDACSQALSKLFIMVSTVGFIDY